jgi:uncharacterized protein YbbK (DUF523 family)
MDFPQKYDTRRVNSPEPDKKILVSACLAGINCTFRGTNNLNYKIKKIVDNQAAIALCPELLGGLGIPRESIELIGGDGYDVLDGRARTISASGKDVTKNVIKGANSVLEIVKKYAIKEAVLKSNSPLCGCGAIYDGTFSKTLRAGDGVLAALLKRNDVKVITEKEV